MRTNVNGHCNRIVQLVVVLLELLRLTVDEVVSDDDIGVIIGVLVDDGCVAEFHDCLVHGGLDFVVLAVLAVLVVALGLDDHTDKAETLALGRHEDLGDTAATCVAQVEERGVSLLHVDVDGTEARHGGGIGLSGDLELGNEDVVVHGCEKALFAERDEALGGLGVDGVELVVDRLVGGVADGELVVLGEEECAEGGLGVEKVERHVEGCATVPVDDAEAVRKGSDAGTVVFASEAVLELVHDVLETVSMFARSTNYLVIVFRAITSSSSGHGSEGENSDREDLH